MLLTTNGAVASSRKTCTTFSLAGFVLALWTELPLAAMLAAPSASAATRAPVMTAGHVLAVLRMSPPRFADAVRVSVTRAMGSARPLRHEFLVPDAEATLAVGPGLQCDQYPDQHGDESERRERRDLRRRRQERHEDRGEDHAPPVQRVHVAVAEGDVGEEVYGQPAEQGERRDGLERVVDVAKGLLHAERHEHDACQHREVQVGVGVAGHGVLYSARGCSLQSAARHECD